MITEKKQILVAGNMMEQSIAMHQMVYLVEIAKKAHSLEKMFKDLVGDTDDWPIKIQCEGKKLEYLVAQRLNELNEALIPFRQEHIEVKQRGSYDSIEEMYEKGVLRRPPPSDDGI